MSPGNVFDRMRNDHARVLQELATLERTLAGLEAVGGMNQGVGKAMRAAVRLLEREFVTHMAAEDEVMFPALARTLPHAAGQFEQLGAEHEELRSMLGSFGRLLGRPGDRERDEQVVVQFRDLLDLLRIHIRKEESAVFRVAERVIKPPMLQAIADRMNSGADKPPSRAPRGHSKGNRT